METNFMAALEAITPKDLERGSTVPKDKLRDELSMAKSRIDGLVSVFSSWKMDGLKNLANRIHDAASDQKNQYCAAYTKIAKAVGSNDLNIAFSSFQSLMPKYNSVLEFTLRNFDTMFQDRYINMANMNVRATAIVGILVETILVCSIGEYLFNGITYEITAKENVSELSAPPKYRLDYVVKWSADYISVVNRMLKANPQALTADLAEGKDLGVGLFDRDGKSNIGTINPELIPLSLRPAISAGSKAFVNVFRWFGEFWMMRNHLKYLRQKKEKEWLQAHVALLQMEMAGVDPNSDEYRRMVKIIDLYNAQIAELDQKIAKYENS